MSVTGDIVESWCRPRRVIRRLVDGGTEAGALAVLMGACLMIFIAMLPGLARTAHLEPEVPLDARMGGALMAVLFFVPLIAYAIAALSHLAACLFGGRGTFLGARMALFWSLLAVSPLTLFQGLASGFLGSGPSVTATGVAVFAGFAYLWLAMLHEAETGAFKRT